MKICEKKSDFREPKIAKCDNGRPRTMSSNLEIAFWEKINWGCLNPFGESFTSLWAPESPE